MDDSLGPLDPGPDGITRYLRMPYRSLGSGAGRNFGLRHVETDYVLFSDDDMVFGPKTDLRKMLRAVETTRFDVVSCMWMDHDSWTSIRRGFNRWEGTLELDAGVLVHSFGKARGERDGLPVFDVVHQFFVAPVDRLGEEPWHPELNMIDHDECFLRLGERGLLCTRLRDVVIYHYPERPPAYKSVRDDTEPMFEKWRQVRGFERREFCGSQFQPLDRLVYGFPSAAAHAARRMARVGRRLLREGRLRAGAISLVLLAALALAPATLAATITFGKGVGPWTLGQKYVKRPGLLRTERHPRNTGPGCVAGPATASRIDFYRRLRLAWRGAGASRGVYLIDIATTEKGDRTRDGFVIGRSRLRGVRRAHPNGRLTHPTDRYGLGRSLVSVVRKTGRESWVSMLYWFDHRGVLVALETSASGC